MAKLYQKLAILAILTHVSPHFKSHNPKVWREATDLGHPPMPNFVKIAKKKSLKGPAYSPQSSLRKVMRIGF